MTPKRPILHLAKPRPPKAEVPAAKPDPLGDEPVMLVVTIEVARRIGLLPKLKGH